MIRVLIVDDQELMRAGFRMILQAGSDIEVVGEAGDGESAISVARACRPDVVLMDIRMPRLDGVEATRRLTGHRVIILTTFDHDEYVVEALRAGASGFLLKDAPPEELIRAVRVVAAGDALLAPAVTRRLLDRIAPTLRMGSSAASHFDQLTSRERDVLQMVARGQSNSEIATRLHIGETTVKTHVSHLLEKLDLRDRVQAVVLAYEAGLVAPGDSAGST
ncbi:MAG TPA: response regulator transcription factor [Candidatus Dormibacteraeota bacterium]|nr:response regulator transcription factor [Candidatus Dormibacteraeota bacterium]